MGYRFVKKYVRSHTGKLVKAKYFGKLSTRSVLRKRRSVSRGARSFLGASIMRKPVRSIFALARRSKGSRLRKLWAMGYAKMKFLKRIH